MMIHAHRKKSATEAKPQGGSGGHNYGTAALGVAGVGAAGYAAHSAMSGSSAPQGSMLRDSSVIYVCLFLVTVGKLICDEASSSRRCPRSTLTAILHRATAASHRRPSISNRLIGADRADMVTPTSIRS